MRKKKMPLWKVLVRCIALVILCVVVAFAALLAVLTITEYKPDDIEPVALTGEAPVESVIPGQVLSVLTWNIGYGALGDNADFFMDGGSKVRTADEGRVRQNMEGILTTLNELDPDIALLQEVDVNSGRSSHIDESALISDNQELRQSSFAANYRSLFIPYPIPPIGKVNAGIQTISKYTAVSSERIQLPCPFRWPLRLGNLKRCLMINRIPVDADASERESGRELVLINLHLEAYDSGEGKAAQTQMLKDILEEESAKGNYVIAGGDFNQTFSNTDISMYPFQEGKWQSGILDTEQFSGNWQFIMDNTTPSCRSLDQPYAGTDPETFQYYMIDGFIVSSNIRIDSCETQDLGFICSDHNPVMLRVTLE